MSFASRLALLLAAATFGPFPAVYAADYDPPIFVEEAAEYVPVEVGSGWYLRGDVGYVASAEVGDVNYGATSFGTQDIDPNFTWGGGFGYHYNDWLRADATVDGFRADFNGSTTSTEPCPAAPVVGTGCRSDDSSEVSVVSVMANGYVDLGTYVGITPYLGGGAGYSYVSWSDLTKQAGCVDGAVVCPATGSVSSEHSGENGWRFTYALMAGIAYDLSQNIKLDLGYKYRHVDGGKMVQWDAAAGSAAGSPDVSGDFDQHEVKVGLRYALW